MPLEQTIDDSVSVEEQLQQDSSYAQTSFTESVKDSIENIDTRLNKILYLQLNNRHSSSRFYIT